MFAQLASVKNFVALKESTGNTRRITDLRNLVGDRYAIFTGVDDLVLESAVLGIDGWVAGAGIAFPAQNQYLWELMQAGEWKKAAEIYRWFTPLLHLDMHVKFVQYIKLAVQECGLGREWTRAPRLPLTGAERKAVLKIIHDCIAKRSKAPEAPMNAHRVEVIDSHTAGEPTRVVIRGGPESGGGSVAEKLSVFRERHEDFRRAVITEPRGSDVLVGALIVPPVDASCAAGVIFFDNVCCLGMCGHGTIGLVRTLAHLGRIRVGRAQDRDGRRRRRLRRCTRMVRSRSSMCLRTAKQKPCRIETHGFGVVTGDVAYGGNWFLLIEDHGQSLDRSNIDALTDFAWWARLAVNARGFPEVDHVILYQDARNFVLCPGREYDRSPCGTGTSARLSCLAAEGRLAEGDSFVQESIVGSHFRAHYRWLDRSRGIIEPTISGQAHIIAEATLLLDPSDPFCHGIR